MVDDLGALRDRWLAEIPTVDIPAGELINQEIFPLVRAWDLLRHRASFDWFRPVPTQVTITAPKNGRSLIHLFTDRTGSERRELYAGLSEKTISSREFQKQLRFEDGVLDQVMDVWRVNDRTGTARAADFVTNLTAVWLMAATWAVSEVGFLPVLNKDDTVASGRALEPFLGAVQRDLDGTELDISEFDEVFIRSQVDAIRSLHRSGQAVPAQITMAIGLIVDRFHSLGLTERDLDAIRARLVTLEPEPDSIIDEIVIQFGDAITAVAHLGDPRDPDDLGTAAEELTAVVEAVEMIDLKVESATPRRDMMLDEAAKSIGKEVGPTLKWTVVAVGGAGAAAAGSQSPAIIELFKRLDEILRIFTGG